MHDPIIFARSQEPSTRLSCIQLLRHGCASNVMKVGRQAFQETSVHRKVIAFKSLQTFIDIILLNRSAIFQRRVFVWKNVKCRGFRLISFTERNVLRLAKY